MILIGLGYKARQGKNYVAECLKMHDKEGVKLYAFADALKRYCKEHHDSLVPKWQLQNQTKQYPTIKADPLYGCTPVLQMVGVDKRKEDPNYWVRQVDAKLADEKPKIAVITDVRFPNEAAYIKQNGGFLVEVRRLNADVTQFVDPDRDSKHISETALDGYEGWDFLIESWDGDFERLRKLAIGVFKAIHYTGVSDNDGTGFKS